MSQTQRHVGESHTMDLHQDSASLSCLITTSTSTLSTPTSCALMNLPPELRHMIWTLVFTTRSTRTTTNPQLHAPQKQNQPSVLLRYRFTSGFLGSPDVRKVEILTRNLNSNILFTSKAIYEDTWPVLASNLELNLMYIGPYNEDFYSVSSATTTQRKEQDPRPLSSSITKIIPPQVCARVPKVVIQYTSPHHHSTHLTSLPSMTNNSNLPNTIPISPTSENFPNLTTLTLRPKLLVNFRESEFLATLGHRIDEYNLMPYDERVSLWSNSYHANSEVILAAVAQDARVASDLAVVEDRRVRRKGDKTEKRMWVVDYLRGKLDSSTSVSVPVPVEEEEDEEEGDRTSSSSSSSSSSSPHMTEEMRRGEWLRRLNAICGEDDDDEQEQQQQQRQEAEGSGGIDVNDDNEWLRRISATSQRLHNAKPSVKNQEIHKLDDKVQFLVQSEITTIAEDPANRSISMETVTITVDASTVRVEGITLDSEFTPYQKTGERSIASSTSR